MKIETFLTLTEEMVGNFEAVFGKQMSLPPTFPMTFYRYIEVPWTYADAPIHRKQSCVCHRKLSVGERYRCVVSLDQELKKGKYTFYTQSLIGYDMKGNECFRCVSDLVAQLP